MCWTSFNRYRHERLKLESIAILKFERPALTIVRRKERLEWMLRKYQEPVRSESRRDEQGNKNRRVQCSSSEKERTTERERVWVRGAGVLLSRLDRVRRIASIDCGRGCAQPTEHNRTANIKKKVRPAYTSAILSEMGCKLEGWDPASSFRTSPLLQPPGLTRLKKKKLQTRQFIYSSRILLKNEKNHCAQGFKFIASYK